MLEHFKEILGEERYNQILQEAEGKTYEELLDERDTLQQENQELKQKYEMQKDSNKLLCKAITCDDCNCSVCEAHKENIELKKQLEEYDRNLFFTKNELDMRQKSIDNKLNQQKEFIEYMEDLIKQNEIVVEVSKYGLPKNCSKLLIDFYKEILSKYKEIIGNDINVDSIGGKDE